MKWVPDEPKGDVVSGQWFIEVPGPHKTRIVVWLTKQGHLFEARQVWHERFERWVFASPFTLVQLNASLQDAEAYVDGIRERLGRVEFVGPENEG